MENRSFPISKEALDTINSMTWFMMDAFWMLGATHVAGFFILPTILSGLFLLYIERRRTVFYINLAINCWIFMNTMWMLSEFSQNSNWLVGSRVAFVAGLGFIAMAVRSSDDLRETFSHFRRFRLLKIK
jgi:hypothetical protein